MNNTTVKNFLGWVVFTYGWLYVNATFFNAIAQAIERHNNVMRSQGFNDGYDFCLKHNNAEETSDKS